MNTDDLTSLLATHVAPIRPRATERRLGRALLIGIPVAVVLMLMCFGLRPDLMAMLSVPMFWGKQMFACSIGLAGWVAVQRVARPGMRLQRAWLGFVVPVVGLWLLAIGVWISTSPADRPDLLWGQTWKGCVLSISLVSLPVFVATFRALRDLAPTRLSLAGASAGALAGGIGAAIYALHCPELAAPFLAVWYVLGMAVPVVVGALIGPRLLRW